MRLSTTGRRCAAHRWWVGGYTAVFIVSLIAAYYHQATVLHAYCPEIGNQVHLAHEQMPHVQGRKDRADAILHEPVHIETSHACLVLAFLAQNAVTRHYPICRDATFVCDKTATRLNELVVFAAGILAVSPKTSPPHA